MSKAQFASIGTRLPLCQTPVAEKQMQTQQSAIHINMIAPVTRTDEPSKNSSHPETVGLSPPGYQSIEKLPYSDSHNNFWPPLMQNDQIGDGHCRTASGFIDADTILQQRNGQSHFLSSNKSIIPFENGTLFDELPELANSQPTLLSPSLLGLLPPSPPPSASKGYQQGFDGMTSQPNLTTSSLSQMNISNDTAGESSKVQEWNADQFAHFLQNYDYLPPLSPIINPTSSDLIELPNNTITTPACLNTNASSIHANLEDVSQWQPAPQVDSLYHPSDPHFDYLSQPAFNLGSQDVLNTTSHTGFALPPQSSSLYPMDLPDLALPQPTFNTFDNTASPLINSSQDLQVLQGNGFHMSENEKNRILIEWKNQGMSYKEIKSRGGFTEAESTLRGRYRTLTKPKHQRVRKPEWRSQDVEILLGAVTTYLQADADDDDDVTTDILKKAAKVPWKQVAEQMEMAGCYRFGNATVKKKYLEVMADRFKLRPES